MSAQGAFLAAASRGERAALVTAVSGLHAGERMLVRANGSREGGLGDGELEARGAAAAQELMWAERPELRDELFVDVVAPAPRVLIFGAVQIAADLARTVRGLGWRPYVIDPRAQFATVERFPDAEEVVVAWPEEAIDRLGGIDRATYVAVLTHDPKIDDQVLTLALESEPAYIGAMGSKRTQAARRERLLAAGVSEEDLARIAAPIGLDVGAVSAEEMAVSIAGELLAARYGRSGGRLSERSR